MRERERDVRTSSGGALELRRAWPVSGYFGDDLASLLVSTVTSNAVAETDLTGVDESSAI